MQFTACINNNNDNNSDRHLCTVTAAQSLQADHQTTANNLGESTCKLLPSTPFITIYQLER